MTLSLVVFLCICAVLIITSWPNAEARAFHRTVRQWRRTARRRALAAWRLTHPLVQRGDLQTILLLLGLAVAVIHLCR